MNNRFSRGFLSFILTGLLVMPPAPILSTARADHYDKTDGSVKEPAADSLSPEAADPAAAQAVSNFNQNIKELNTALAEAAEKTDFIPRNFAEESLIRIEAAYKDLEAFNGKLDQMYSQVDGLFSQLDNLVNDINGREKVDAAAAGQFNSQTADLAAQVDPMIKDVDAVIGRVDALAAEIDAAVGRGDELLKAGEGAGNNLTEILKQFDEAQKAFAELQELLKKNDMTLTSPGQLDDFFKDAGAYLESLKTYNGDSLKYLQDLKKYFSEVLQNVQQVRKDLEDIRDYFRKVRDLIAGTKVGPDEEKKKKRDEMVDLVEPPASTDEDAFCQGLDEKYYSYETCRDMCKYRTCHFKTGKDGNNCYECPSGGESCYDIGRFPIDSGWCAPGGFCYVIPEMVCTPPTSTVTANNFRLTCTDCQKRPDMCWQYAPDSTSYSSCKAGCSDGICVYRGFYEEPEWDGTLEQLHCFECVKQPGKPTCEEMGWGYDWENACNADCPDPGHCEEAKFTPTDDEIKEIEEKRHQEWTDAKNGGGGAPGKLDPPETPPPAPSAGGEPGGKKPGDQPPGGGGGGLAPGQGQQNAPGGSRERPGQGPQVEEGKVGEPGGGPGEGTQTGGTPVTGGTQEPETPGGKVGPPGQPEQPGPQGEGSHTQTPDQPDQPRKPEVNQPTPPTVERPSAPVGNPPQAPEQQAATQTKKTEGCIQVGKNTRVGAFSQCPNALVADGTAPNGEECFRCPGEVTEGEAPKPEEPKQEQPPAAPTQERPQEEKKEEPKVEEAAPPAVTVVKEEVVPMGGGNRITTRTYSDGTKEEERKVGTTLTTVRYDNNGKEIGRTMSDSGKVTESQGYQTLSEYREDPCKDKDKSSAFHGDENETLAKNTFRNEWITAYNGGPSSYHAFRNKMLKDKTTPTQHRNWFIEMDRKLREMSESQDPCLRLLYPPEPAPGSQARPQKDPCEEKTKALVSGPGNEPAGKKALRDQMIAAMRSGGAGFNTFYSGVMNDVKSTTEQINWLNELQKEATDYSKDPCHGPAEAKPGEPKSGETGQPGEGTTARPKDPCEEAFRKFSDGKTDDSAELKAFRARYINALQQGPEKFEEFASGLMNDPKTPRSVIDQYAQVDQAYKVFTKDPCHPATPTTQPPPSTRTSTPGGETTQTTVAEDLCKDALAKFTQNSNDSPGRSEMRQNFIDAINMGPETFEELRQSVMDDPESTQEMKDDFDAIYQEYAAFSEDPCHNAREAMAQTTSGPTQTADPCANRRTLSDPAEGESSEMQNFRSQFNEALKAGPAVFQQFRDSIMSNQNTSTETLKMYRDMLNEQTRFEDDPCSLGFKTGLLPPAPEIECPDGTKARPFQTPPEGEAEGKSKLRQNFLQHATEGDMSVAQFLHDTYESANATDQGRQWMDELLREAEILSENPCLGTFTGSGIKDPCEKHRPGNIANSPKEVEPAGKSAMRARFTEALRQGGQALTELEINMQSSSNTYEQHWIAELKEEFDGYMNHPCYDIRLDINLPSEGTGTGPAAPTQIEVQDLAVKFTEGLEMGKRKKFEIKTVGGTDQVIETFENGHTLTGTIADDATYDVLKDKDGREIRSLTTYPDGSRELVTTEYDAEGKPLRTIEKVSADGKTSVVTLPENTVIETKIADDKLTKTEVTNHRFGYRTTRTIDGDGNVLSEETVVTGEKIAFGDNLKRLCFLKNLVEHKPICFPQINKGKNNRFSAPSKRYTSLRGEKEAGQVYYETQIAKPESEGWKTLPAWMKEQFASSERYLKSIERQRRLSQQLEEQNRLEDENRGLWFETLGVETDIKLTRIKREQEEADRRTRIRLQKEARQNQIQSLIDEQKENRIKYRQAQARGDYRSMRHLEFKMELISDISMEVFQFTKEEAAEAELKDQRRSELMNDLRRQALTLSYHRMEGDRIVQDAKEQFNNYTKWLLIGAEQSQGTAKNTRINDRLLAYSQAKLDVLQGWLNRKNISDTDRDIIRNMLDMAYLQEQSASFALSSNTNLTAAGYAIDIGLLVSGGKLFTTGVRLGNALVRGTARVARGIVTEVGSQAAGQAATQAAAWVVNRVTQRGVTQLVVGAKNLTVRPVSNLLTRATVRTASRVFGEKTAYRLARVLTADTITGVASRVRVVGTAIARVAPKVIGESGVRVVGTGAYYLYNGSAAVVKGLFSDVREIPGWFARKEPGMTRLAGHAYELSGFKPSSGATVEFRELPRLLSAPVTGVPIRGNPRVSINNPRAPAISAGRDARPSVGGLREGTRIQPPLKETPGDYAYDLRTEAGRKALEAENRAIQTEVEKARMWGEETARSERELWFPLEWHPWYKRLPSKGATTTPPVRAVQDGVGIMIDRPGIPPTYRGSAGQLSSEGASTIIDRAPRGSSTFVDRPGTGSNVPNIEKDFSIDLTTQSGLRQMDDAIRQASAARNAQRLHLENGGRLPPRHPQDLFSQTGFRDLPEKTKVFKKPDLPESLTRTGPGDTQMVGRQGAGDTQVIGRQGSGGTEVLKPTPIIHSDASAITRPGSGISLAEGRARPPISGGRGPTVGPSRTGPTVKPIDEFAKRRVDDYTGRIPPSAVEQQYLIDKMLHKKALEDWLLRSQSERQVLDGAIIKALEDAASMGNVWARRLLRDLKAGKFDFYYTSRLSAKGLAFGDNYVLINPLKRPGISDKFHSADDLASTLLHEYVHIYKGKTLGGAVKGGYNEIRAFWAEAMFNRDLQRSRAFWGEKFDDKTLRELETLLGLKRMQDGVSSMARGLKMRRNLQRGLVEDYPYGRDYQDKLPEAIANLSTYKGGSLRGLRERLRDAYEATTDYAKLEKLIEREMSKKRPEPVTYHELLKRILEEGGAVRPVTATPIKGLDRNLTNLSLPPLPPMPMPILRPPARVGPSSQASIGGSRSVPIEPSRPLIRPPNSPTVGGPYGVDIIPAKPTPIIHSDASAIKPKPVSTPITGEPRPSIKPLSSPTVKKGDVGGRTIQPKMEFWHEYRTRWDLRNKKAPVKMDAEDLITFPYRRKARTFWRLASDTKKEALERSIIKSLEDAAMMGNKWARRLLKELETRRFTFHYDPALDAKGMAFDNSFVVINPYKNPGLSMELYSGDALASTLLHEYVHSYRGYTFGGNMKTGYNEIRAFWAETMFNRDLKKYREFWGEKFDDSTLKELETLMGVDPTNGVEVGSSMARGLQLRRNLQRGLIEDYSYGKTYQKNINHVLQNLSTYKGGSLRGIRERLEQALLAEDDVDVALERFLREYGKGHPEPVQYSELVEHMLEQGGAVRPKSAPPLDGFSKDLTNVPAKMKKDSSRVIRSQSDTISRQKGQSPDSVDPDTAAIKKPDLQKLADDAAAKQLRTAPEEGGKDYLGAGSLTSLKQILPEDFVADWFARTEYDQIGLLEQWADELGIPEFTIQYALSKAKPIKALYELILRKEGLQVASFPEALEVLGLATRVQSKNATTADRLLIGRRVEEYQDRGLDYFTELRKKVLLSMDENKNVLEGYERIINDEAVDVIKKFYENK